MDAGTHLFIQELLRAFHVRDGDTQVNKRYLTSRSLYSGRERQEYEFLIAALTNYLGS